MIGVNKFQKPAHHLAYTLKMSGPVAALQNGFQFAEVISFQTGLSMRINFLNSGPENYICACSGKHFNILFCTDRVFFKVNRIIELDGVHKNAAYSDVREGLAGFNQPDMPSVEGSHRGDKAGF